MTKPTERDLIFRSAAPSMLASGLRTSRMEGVRRLGPMRLFILESIRMARSMERASLCGPMTVLMKAISSKIIFTALENTNGKTDESMKENGRTTKCKAKAPSHGPMEENTSETTFKTEKKALESSLLRTAESTKASGLMENSTEGESSKRKVFRERESGKMAKGSNGSMKKKKTAISRSPKNNKNQNLLSTTLCKSPSSLHILPLETYPFIDFICDFIWFLKSILCLLINLL